MGQQGDRAHQHADQEREPDIEVPDVGQLVADDALELLAVKLLEESGRDGNRRVLRIPTRGERVGCGVLDQVDRRHRDVRRESQFLDDVHQLGRLRRIDPLRVRGGEDEPVAGEVTPERGHDADDQGDQRGPDPAGRIAGQRVADGKAERPEQEADEDRQKERVPAVRRLLGEERGCSHGGANYPGRRPGPSIS